MKLISAQELINDHGFTGKQILDIVYNNDDIKFYNEQGTVKGCCDNENNFVPFSGKDLIADKIRFYYLIMIKDDKTEIIPLHNKDLKPGILNAILKRTNLKR